MISSESCKEGVFGDPAWMHKPMPAATWLKARSCELQLRVAQTGLSVMALL